MAVTPKSKTIRKYWKRHVNRWQASGWSRQKYSDENKLNAKTFAYWCRQFGFRTDFRKSRGNIAPKVSNGNLPVTFVPLSIPQAKVQTAEKIAVIVKGRFRVVVPEGFSPGFISEIVSTLERIP